MKRICLTLLGLCLFNPSNPLAAQSSGGWSKIAPAPEGMSVIDMASDNNNRIYVLNTSSEVYYTANNGLSWSKIPGTLPIMNVDDIEVDKTSNTLYLNCFKEGIYWTSNLGASWQNEYFFTNSVSGAHANIYKSARKAGTGTLVCGEIFGSHGSLSTSARFNITLNLGFSWTTSTVSFGIRDLKYATNGDLFCAGHDNIYKSTNNGLTWSASGTGLSGFETSCFLEKTQASLLVVGAKFNANTNDSSGCGIFISHDGGLTWVNSSAGMTDRRVESITEGPGGVLYACTPDHVYYSSNNGASWNALNAGLSPGANAVLSANASGVFMGSRNSGTAFSASTSQPWQYRNSGQLLQTINSLCLGSNNSLFVSDYVTTGVHRYAGNAWSATNTGFPATSCNGVTRDGNGNLYAGVLGKNIYGATISPVYKSTNQGATWTPIGTLPLQPASLYAYAYAQVKTDPNNHIYALVRYSPSGLVPDEVFRSTNGGLNWTTVYSGNASASIDDLQLAPDSTVYFSTSSFFTGQQVIEYSRNWSSTIDTLNIKIDTLTFSPYYRLRVAPDNSLYVAYGTELYHYTGNAWQQLTNGGWGTNSGNIGDIELVINNQNELFATCFSCGVYKSINNGTSWTNISNGLPQYTPASSGTPVIITLRDFQFDSNGLPYASFFEDGGNNLMGIYRYAVGTGNPALTGPEVMDNAFDHMQVYPNPAQGEITNLLIQSKEPGAATIQLMNQEGQLVLSIPNQNLAEGRNIIPINTKNLASGLYFIKASKGVSAIGTKFIRE